MLQSRYYQSDDLSEGSLDFNSSHGSYKFDYDDVACFGGGRSPLSWLKGWNTEERRSESKKSPLETFTGMQKKQDMNSSTGNLSFTLDKSSQLTSDTVSTSASTAVFGEDTKSNTLQNSKMATSISAASLHTVNSSESRIVAPYVSKISPHSAVEIKLQSQAETVSVLCSVDVLKMRSTFFYELLHEQDKARSTDKKSFSSAMRNHSYQFKASDQSAKYEDYLNKMWRPTIVIPETSPYEAAALLESLHEGRYVMVMPPPANLQTPNMDEYFIHSSTGGHPNTSSSTCPTATTTAPSYYGNEWCYTWVRLAVGWGMGDLIQSFAYLIDHHFERVISLLRRWHWRCNPSVLTGMKVAIIKKSKYLLPTVITGTVIEPGSAPSYSKIRVKFDPHQEISKDTSSLGSTKMSGSVSIAHIMSFNNQEVKTLMRNRSVNNFSLPSPISPYSTLVNKNTRFNTRKDREDDIGLEDVLEEDEEKDEEDQGTDISESFLVQTSVTKTSGSLNTLSNSSSNTSLNSTSHSTSSSPSAFQWIDPDELFLSTYGSQIFNLADKRMFWEMVNVICEHKVIQSKCNTPLANFNVLSDTIKRKEFKVLWTQEGVDLLPQKLAIEFIKSNYV